MSASAAQDRGHGIQGREEALVSYGRVRTQWCRRMSKTIERLCFGDDVAAKVTESMGKGRMMVRGLFSKSYLDVPASQADAGD
nr:hypothetical protein CFP56_22124 [Quercus suber]